MSPRPPEDDRGDIAALVRALRPPRDTPELHLRHGIVMAVDPPTCTVRIGDADDPAGDVDGVSYYTRAAPGIGAAVELLANGSDWRVVGEVNLSTLTRVQRRLLTDGDRLRSSTTWATFDTALDLELAAREGQSILYGLSAFANAAGFRTYFDVSTLNDAGHVSAISGATFGGLGTTTGNGAPGWTAGESNAAGPIGGTVLYTLKAADITTRSDGEPGVVLRLRYRNSATGTRTLVARTDWPMMAWAAVLAA